MTKQTVLTQDHQKRGAKLIPFAGYEMPVWFDTLKQEHLAVRSDVGIFDISHMGVLWINGPSVKSDLQNLSCNRILDEDQPKMVFGISRLCYVKT